LKEPVTAADKLNFVIGVIKHPIASRLSLWPEGPTTNETSWLFKFERFLDMTYYRAWLADTMTFEETWLFFGDDNWSLRDKAQIKSTNEQRI